VAIDAAEVGNVAGEYGMRPVSGVKDGGEVTVGDRDTQR
jgi:hypothetical protein